MIKREVDVEKLRMDLQEIAKDLGRIENKLFLIQSMVRRLEEDV